MIISYLCGKLNLRELRGHKDVQVLSYKLSFCYKLKFSYPYIFVTQYRRFLIFQTMKSVRSNNKFEISKILTIQMQRYSDQKIGSNSVPLTFSFCLVEQHFVVFSLISFIFLFPSFILCLTFIALNSTIKNFEIFHYLVKVYIGE